MLNVIILEKIHEEMKIVAILPTKPKKKIKLDPINIEDLTIDLDVIQEWSRNNL